MGVILKLSLKRPAKNSYNTQSVQRAFMPQMFHNWASPKRRRVYAVPHTLYERGPYDNDCSPDMPAEYKTPISLMKGDDRQSLRDAADTARSHSPRLANVTYDVAQMLFITVH